MLLLTSVLPFDLILFPPAAGREICFMEDEQDIVGGFIVICPLVQVVSLLLLGGHLTQ